MFFQYLYFFIFIYFLLLLFCCCLLFSILFELFSCLLYFFIFNIFSFYIQFYFVFYFHTILIHVLQLQISEERNRLRTKQVQGTYFENGCSQGKELVPSSFQFFQASPSPSTFLYSTSQKTYQLLLQSTSTTVYCFLFYLNYLVVYYTFFIFNIFASHIQFHFVFHFHTYSCLEVSNFTRTKIRFRTKQVQGTYFENGFRQGKELVPSSFQSFQANPSPSAFLCSTSQST